MTTFTRILGLTTLLTGIVLVGYWRLSASQKDRAIAELRELNQQMEHALAQRQAMVERPQPLAPRGARARHRPAVFGPGRSGIHKHRLH